MNVNIAYGIEGAKIARGITVIVDIYRAASTATYALGQKAKYVIPVATKEEALTLKKQNPDYLLMGEEHGFRINEFNFGNSPHELMQADLENKILVQRTSKGTQGLVNATKADELIFGSFPTISAIAAYIKRKSPQEITIVAMDGEDSEDEVFAIYLKSQLMQDPVNPEITKTYLMNHRVSVRFLDPNQPEFPKEDINYCLDIDRFNFVCLVKKIGNQLRIVKISYKDEIGLERYAQRKT